MRYCFPLAASTVCIATVSLTACGGGDDKAASITAPSTVSTTSSATAPPSSTSQPTSTSATTRTSASPKPATSTTTTATRTVAPSTTPKPTTKATTAKPTTKAAPAAPVKKKGCFTSDGKSLFLEGVSCEFAQNAYTVYTGGYVPNSTGQYQAKSPNGTTYTFNCMSNTEGVTNCGGGTLKPGSLFAWQN